MEAYEFLCFDSSEENLSRGVTSRFQLFRLTLTETFVLLVLPITLCLLLQPATLRETRGWTIFDAAVVPDMEVSQGPLTHHDPVNQSSTVGRGPTSSDPGHDNADVQWQCALQRHNSGNLYSLRLTPKDASGTKLSSSHDDGIMIQKIVRVKYTNR
jgi:hypothetical protein